MADTTVILPIYNEQSLVESTFQAVAQFAREHPRFQFCFVDDGSTDATRENIRQCLATDPEASVALMAYDDNQGKGHAVKTGSLAAQTPYICFTDADLAYSLDHLIALRDALEHADMVIGSRTLGDAHRENITALRRITGTSFNLLARLILNLPYTDTQAGLKGYKREVAQDIFNRMRLTRFSFDVELLFIGHHHHDRIAVIPASVNEHHSDKTSKVRILRDSFRMFWALLRVRYHQLAGHYAAD